MHSLEIEKQIIAHLLTCPGLDSKRVTSENVNYTPPTTGVWARVTVLGGINFISGLADTPCTREVGTLVIQCFDRENTSIIGVKTFADNLAKHFAYYQTDKLELLAPSVIYVGLNTDTKFFQYNVSIPYRYN